MKVFKRLHSNETIGTWADPVRVPAGGKENMFFRAAVRTWCSSIDFPSHVPLSRLPKVVRVGEREATGTVDIEQSRLLFDPELVLEPGEVLSFEVHNESAEDLFMSPVVRGTQS